MVRATSLLCAAAAAAVLLMSPAAVAGDAEVAYLHSLAGDWVGSATVTGPDGGNVACRVVIKPSGTRLNFSGRCAAPGNAQAQSFSGTIRYNDQRRRYESSSSGKTVPGQVQGSTLLFVTEMTTLQGDISSTMTVSPKSLKMQFRVTDTKGRTHEGSIPFSRS